MDERPPTLTETLARYFRAHPNVWVDGRLIARIAGFAGWRARISDLRRPPYNMRVSNQQRRALVNGVNIRITEYRYEPAVETKVRSETPQQPGLWP